MSDTISGVDDTSTSVIRVSLMGGGLMSTDCASLRMGMCLCGVCFFTQF